MTKETKARAMGPKVTVDVSVIICCYTTERWAYLVEAVASVQKQTVQPREIIVVVDHNPALLALAQARFANGLDLSQSGGDSREQEKWRQADHLIGGTHPNIIVLENQQARGLSGARNSALAVAQGELLAFLDDDAVAYYDWLERLVAAYIEPQVLGVGGAIMAHWEAGRPAWFPEEFDWVVGCTYRGVSAALQPVRNMIAANMSMRRQVIETLGGFRNGMGRLGKTPYGCEETELCIRAYQQWPDGVVLHEPRARVFHHVPATRAQWNYFKARCYAEGLSKAQVVRYVGGEAGLAAERSYTLRTLPLGVLRGVTDLAQGDRGGLQRAGAIVAGLVITASGYGVGRCKGWLAERRHSPLQPQIQPVV
ncbi:MAG: glycosyltransferase [Caldilineaceae bacterium]